MIGNFSYVYKIQHLSEEIHKHQIDYKTSSFVLFGQIKVLDCFRNTLILHGFLRSIDLKSISWGRRTKAYCTILKNYYASVEQRNF